MKNIFSIILLVFSGFLFSQEVKNSIVNPRDKWFFGAEIGTNIITSFSQNESNKSFQGGFLAEYYFAKNWSAIARVKYFKTGLSFIKTDSYGTFNGAVLSVPINIKWEYKVVKNFRGNFKLGMAINREVESNYYYSPNAKTDYNKLFNTFNTGIGFNYFLNEKMAIYAEYESYIWGNDRDESDFLEIEPNSTNNNLINIGFKYNFTK